MATTDEDRRRLKELFDRIKARAEDDVPREQASRPKPPRHWADPDDEDTRRGAD